MNVFFSVGEPSGDEHAAGLIRQLRKKSPGVTCCGFGGPRMQEEGCDLHYPLTDLAVMGIFQVIPLLWQFLTLVRRARRIFREDPPDAVVLVDFPGFNWWIARAAKSAGVPVFYYLPPQLWAWGSWRIRRIRKYVDHVICALPFEPEWYAKRGVQVEHVGHPFFDEVAETKLDEAFLNRWKRDERVVGILPGSRTQEVTENFPLQVEVIRDLVAQEPNVRYLIACYTEAHRDWCRDHIESVEATDLPITLCLRKTSEIIELSEFCLLVSGSVSLELLARRTSGVVMYACGRVFYELASRLVRLDSITLPNLMAGRVLYPEFIMPGRDRKQVEAIKGILGGWLSDPQLLRLTREQLDTLYNEIVEPGASGRAADVILKKLGIAIHSSKPKDSAAFESVEQAA